MLTASSHYACLYAVLEATVPCYMPICIAIACQYYCWTAVNKYVTLYLVSFHMVNYSLLK